MTSLRASRAAGLHLGRAAELRDSPHLILPVLIWQSRSMTTARRQKYLPASYYRGGTSRAVMFNEHDLPKDRKDWAPIFLATIGGNDINGRQLDGMGGGVSSLSKICVVGPSSHPEADVDYTFAAIGVTDNEVDYSANCGNMTSAIGPFAVDTGMVNSKEDGDAVVRIHNTNTGKVIHATFPVIEGEAAAHGDFAIDGVAGTAAKVQLAFINPAGSKTGKLLPTDKISDIFSGIKATCIDAGNPCVFVAASSLGVDGTILPDTVDTHPTLLSTLDGIRRQASVTMGLSKDEASATGSIPKIAMVSPPSTHTLLSGQTLPGKDVDLVVRAISVGQPHRAVPITVAMAIAAAGNVKGSVVEECLSNARVDPDGITLGHSTGKIVVGSKYDEQGNLLNATVFRTARRLMEGKVFWK